MTNDHAEFPERTEIVCLCGSTRFVREIAAANAELSLAGAIVLAPGVLSRADSSGLELTGSQRAALGELHLRKIDLADRVLIVNPGGYVGESTRREIEYARAAGVPVEFTEGNTE